MGNTKWTTPKVCWEKANVDVACYFGSCCEGSQRRPSLCRFEEVSKLSVLGNELLVARWGLGLASSQSYPKIILELDCNQAAFEIIKEIYPKRLSDTVIEFIWQHISPPKTELLTRFLAHGRLKKGSCLLSLNLISHEQAL